MTPQQAATHDTTRVDDVRIAAVRALVAPAVLLEELPASPEVEALVEQARAAIGRVLTGTDDRLVSNEAAHAFPGAECVNLSGRGHNTLLYDPAVASIVVRRIHAHAPRPLPT